MAASTESQALWFRSHVTAQLRELMDNVEGDDDGDFGIRGESSRGWLRVETFTPWGAHILVSAAHDVPVKLATLREINQINIAEPLVKVILHDQGTVVVSVRLLADAVTVENLAGAIGKVLSVADRIGPLMVAVYGGQTPAEAEALLTVDE